MTQTREFGLGLLVVCFLLYSPISVGGTDELDGIIPGNWVQVRGQMDEHGVFQARRIELLNPEGDQLLIGTVSAVSPAGELTLLGQSIQVSQKTKYSKVTADNLLGTRVKVEGRYLGPNRFSAWKIKARSPGSDRIAGAISDISPVSDGYSLTIINQKIHLSHVVELEHERPVAEYAIASLNAALPAAGQVQEDKQFGKGLRISDRVLFTAIIDGRYTKEDNYNLKKTNEEDRQDSAASVRGRVVVLPSDNGVSGQLEVRYTRLNRDDEDKGTTTEDDIRLSESFIYFDGLFGTDLDIQAGRINFDDRREWLYDQSLDGLRTFWRVGDWLAELSATTTLSDGSQWDKDTYNYMAYISDIDRNFAAYVIHRDTNQSGANQNITHFGARAFGAWPPKHDSWLEISGIQGEREGIDLGGWGLDIGTTRFIGERWNLTAGWAYGQGDDNTKDGSDNNFRQTGLQDNNGRFGGVTSFRYYGELFDPELANLHIGTLGAGFLFTPKGSIDLVGHYYRQDKAARRIIDSDIDRRPNGIDRELGWEVNAIVGWRPVRAWDFELVLAWFKPGEAFENRDEAWLGKMNLRYRY
ncbi:MAG: alginate export family protein [Halioglobus sp.]